MQIHGKEYFEENAKKRRQGKNGLIRSYLESLELHAVLEVKDKELGKTYHPAQIAYDLSKILKFEKKFSVSRGKDKKSWLFLRVK